MKRILIAGVLAAMLGLTACSGTAQQSSGAEIEETSSKESRSLSSSRSTSFFACSAFSSSHPTIWPLRLR